MAKPTARYFLEQRDKLEQNETPTDEMIATINSEVDLDGTWLRDFGLDLSGANPAPQVFMLKDGKVTSLSESNVKPGSREFWESAMKGQLFGYKAGEKEPVQLQAWMGYAGLKCAVSEPLEPGKEAKFPNEPVKLETPANLIKPEYPKPPKEVRKPGDEPARPGFFTRLGAALGIKSSIDRIAMHTAWVDQSAAYEKYQADKAEYDEDLASGELDRKYAKEMRDYYTKSTARRIQGYGNRGIVDTYELEHAAWEKESANREQLSKAREQSAKAISDALGKSRTNAVLEAEKQAAKERKTFRSAMQDRLNIRQGIENMLSMYGAKPYAKEQFLLDGRYGAKDIEALSQISLDGLTVGSKQSRPITNEDFGALTMFSMVTPENGKKMSADNAPPVVDYEGTVKAFEEMGFNAQEVGELMANQYVGVMTTDVIRADAPRNAMGIAFKEYVEPARQKTLQALQEYQNGNKQPLADIISRGVEYSDYTVRTSADVDGCTSGLMLMANNMVDMMERDPELKTLAAKSFEQREKSMCDHHKELQPRTMNDLIKDVKAHVKLQELRQKSAEATEKLLRSQAGKLNLSDQEKKDCLRDVMKCNTVNAMYKAQTNMLAKQAIRDAAPITDHFTEKYANHATLSMLAATGDMLVQSRFAKRAPDEKTPSMLDTINSKKAMQTMDAELDRTIEADIQSAGLDEMCKKALSTADPTYSGQTLAEKMKTALSPKPEPEKVKTVEKEIEQPKLAQEMGAAGP